MINAKSTLASRRDSFLAAFLVNDDQFQAMTSRMAFDVETMGSVEEGPKTTVTYSRCGSGSAGAHKPNRTTRRIRGSRRPTR